MDKNKLAITECFYTLSGEGDDIGVPTTYVRLFGCNLKCPWCIEENTKITLSDGSKKKAKNIKIGDKLLTPFGETEVYNVLSRNVKKYKKITLENGKQLICTEDHPLILPNGSEIQASKLNIGDKILAEK